MHRVHQMRYSTLAERCSIAGAAAACPSVRLRAITDGMDCKLNGGSHACMHTRMHISRMSNELRPRRSHQHIALCTLIHTCTCSINGYLESGRGVGLVWQRAPRESHHFLQGGGGREKSLLPGLDSTACVQPQQTCGNDCKQRVRGTVH